MAGGPGTVTGYSILADRSFALSVPGHVDNLNLTADTPESVTCPEGATIALFQGTVDFGVAYNRAGDSYVADLSADVTDGTGCELNPSVRYIGRVGQTGSIESLSIVTTADGVVSISFYKA